LKKKSLKERESFASGTTLAIREEGGKLLLYVAQKMAGEVSSTGGKQLIPLDGVKH
jgi:hypothetical protein